MPETMRIRAPRKLALIASTATLLMGAHAAAAEAAASEVSEIVVSGRLEETLPSQLAKYGTRVDVVTSDQIEAGNFADLGMVLQKYVPGLYIAPQSGPFSYVAASLQGSRPSEILYMIDGVRISNRLYATTPPLDSVPAHMVDHVEVLDGGQGLFYGTQAVAGAINIVTRPFTTMTTGRLSIGGDTNDSFTANGYISGALGASQFVAFASYDESEGFQPYPDADYQPSGTDRNRGYRLTSGGLKYAYDFSNDVRFSASYVHTEGWVDFNRPTDAASTLNERDEDLATAKLDWTINDKTQLFVKGYYHDWDSHYDEVDNLPGGGFDHVDDHEFWGYWDYGLNAMAKFAPTAGVEVYVGYDMQKYWGRDDVLLIADKTEMTQAVFGQLRLGPDLLANTHLAIGARYNAPDNGDGVTVWNATGQYDITDMVFVRGSLGTSFRLPDAESLFANDPINNGEIGNPDLKPETANFFNGSIGGQGMGWNWELIGFYRQTKNLIDLSGETPDPDVFTFINLPDKVTAKGFEAVGQVSPTPWVSLQGSYTHAQTRQSGSSQQLVGIPEDIGQVVVDIHPVGRGFGGSLAGNWVGNVVDNVSSGFGRQQHGDYFVLDLNAYVAFGPGDRQRINVTLANALDEDYATRVGRAFRDSDGSAYLVHSLGAPRTFHVSYSYNF